MGDKTKIEWCHKTFNPWLGCTKISPGCDNCYAEKRDHQYGGDHWASLTPPRMMADSNWKRPYTWNRRAAKQGVRFRVFCGSMCDVFDNRAPAGQRARLFKVIRETPNLDWLLLTKRSSLIKRFLPSDWGDGYPNVWLGVSAETHAHAKKRIADLREIPAAIRFASFEPLLGDVTNGWLDDPRHWKIPPVKISVSICGSEASLASIISMADHGRKKEEHQGLNLFGIDWAIIGGESGYGARRMDPDWFGAIHRLCRAYTIPIFFKQWGGVGKEKGGCIVDGTEIKEFPEVEIAWLNRSK